MADDYRNKRWHGQMEDIDKEIARLAVSCRIRLLDPGVIERVIQKDTGVCGTQNERAFTKLRSLLMMHYSARERAVVAIGEAETLAMIGEIVARLRERLGDKLGGPPAA